MRKLSSLIMALAAAVVGVAPVTVAGAGGEEPPEDSLRVELLSTTEPLRFSLEIDPAEVVCEEGTFTVELVEVYDYDTELLVTTVTPVSVTEDPSDPNSAEMVLPSDTPGGAIYVVASCDDGNDSESADIVQVDGGVLVATLGITKVVDGPAPADATFTVRVDCSDVTLGVSERGTWSGATAQEVGNTFVVDLTFPVTGGTQYVYMDDGGLCVITEPGTGGASSVTVSNDIDTRPAPAPYSSTVTNTFAAALEPNFTG